MSGGEGDYRFDRVTDHIRPSGPTARVAVAGHSPHPEGLERHPQDLGDIARQQEVAPPEPRQDVIGVVVNDLDLDMTEGRPLPPRTDCGCLGLWRRRARCMGGGEEAQGDGSSLPTNQPGGAGGTCAAPRLYMGPRVGDPQNDPGR